MSVKIYLDYMSQPSRAVYAYCKAAEIPHEVIEVRIVSGDLRKPEFQKINPMRKVPAIEYKGFHLYESHAILVYLANKFGKAENLYPKDLEKRAVIDAYLHWHHQNTRKCAMLFQANNPQFFPNLKLTKEEAYKDVDSVLKFIQKKFLANQNYLCDKDNLTIADISAACEINQLHLFGFDFTPYPQIKEWLERCLSHPAMKEAHVPFYKVLEKMKAKPKL